MLLGKTTVSQVICHCLYFYDILLSQLRNLYLLPVHIRKVASGDTFLLESKDKNGSSEMVRISYVNL